MQITQIIRWKCSGQFSIHNFPSSINLHSFIHSYISPLSLSPLSIYLFPSFITITLFLSVFVSHCFIHFLFPHHHHSVSVTVSISLSLPLSPPTLFCLCLCSPPPLSLSFHQFLIPLCALVLPFAFHLHLSSSSYFSPRLFSLLSLPILYMCQTTRSCFLSFTSCFFLFPSLCFLAFHPTFSLPPCPFHSLPLTYPIFCSCFSVSFLSRFTSISFFFALLQTHISPLIHKQFTT